MENILNTHAKNLYEKCPQLYTITKEDWAFRGINIDSIKTLNDAKNIFEIINANIQKYGNFPCNCINSICDNINKKYTKALM